MSGAAAPIPSSDRAIATARRGWDPRGMTTLDPQVTGALTAAVAAAAMIVLSRAKGMLKLRIPRRCAACGRFVEPGRGCSHCR